MKSVYWFFFSLLHVELRGQSGTVATTTPTRAVAVATKNLSATGVTPTRTRSSSEHQCCGFSGRSGSRSSRPSSQWTTNRCSRPASHLRRNVALVQSGLLPDRVVAAPSSRSVPQFPSTTATTVVRLVVVARRLVVGWIVVPHPGRSLLVSHCWHPIRFLVRCHATQYVPPCRVRRSSTTQPVRHGCFGVVLHCNGGGSSCRRRRNRNWRWIADLPSGTFQHVVQLQHTVGDVTVSAAPTGPTNATSIAAANECWRLVRQQQRCHWRSCTASTTPHTVDIGKYRWVVGVPIGSVGTRTTTTRTR